MDNGPEFISNELDNWSKENKIILVFIQPGKPYNVQMLEHYKYSFIFYSLIL